VFNFPYDDNIQNQAKIWKHIKPKTLRNIKQSKDLKTYQTKDFKKYKQFQKEC